MDFRNYVEPHESVKIKTATGSESVAVYGLGIEQVMFLARDYAGQLAPIYKDIVEQKLDEAGLYGALVEMLDEVPTLINMIVFFGLRCEEEEMMDTIAKMPGGVRIELVDAITRLTFHSENGGGKVLGIVASVFKKAAGEVRFRKT